MDLLAVCQGEKNVILGGMILTVIVCIIWILIIYSIMKHEYNLQAKWWDSDAKYWKKATVYYRTILDENKIKYMKYDSFTSDILGLDIDITKYDNEPKHRISKMANTELMKMLQEEEK